MYCPFCQAEDTKVIDSRLVADGSQIRRRRECEVCHSRFTTFETIDLALPRVIKSNGERQPFNGSKLKSGMLRALEKRPLSTEEIDSVFGKILKERSFGIDNRNVVTEYPRKSLVIAAPHTSNWDFLFGRCFAYIVGFSPKYLIKSELFLPFLVHCGNNSTYKLVIHSF